GGADQVDLPTLVGAVRVAIMEETYFVAPPTRAHRVRVMRLLDLRGARATRLHLGGLTEAALPGPPPPALLLGEADRRRLGLPTHDDTLAELGHLFALALAAPG